MITATKEKITLNPTRQEAHKYFEYGNLLPVYQTMLADLETPVSVYLKLKQIGAVAFLLESVEGGTQVGRYSFLGVNPKSKISVNNRFVQYATQNGVEENVLPPGRDPLDIIKRELTRFNPIKIEGLPRFVGGAVGYLGYDVVRHFEKLPETAVRDIETPDMVFLMVDTLVIFDHARHELIILSNAYNSGDPDIAYDEAVARIDAITEALHQPLPPVPSTSLPLDEALVSNITRERFENNVRKAKEYITAGDAFQIVLSQRFTRSTSAHPLSIYRTLRTINPSPYMFFFEFDNSLSLIGASPEMMVRLSGRVASVRPIAGTRRRGVNRSQDDKLAQELLDDPKERAEHVMLVDLGRNDLGRVCKYGTVRVPRMMFIERYSHVMHIVSQVEGKLRPEMDAFDLLRATFPAGTLSGAPKIRAMEIIEELEGSRRGPYGGAVGYFNYDGSMDTCITIRTIMMQGNQAYIQAGAGIVADSDPSYEYEETVNKARALAVAIERAEQNPI